MAIEFRCTQCNKLLRTGDETVGKQARCPECGAITVVPQPDSIPESASEPSQDSGPFSDTLPGSTPPPSPTPHEAGSPFGGDSPFASGAVPPPGGTSDTDNPYQSPSDFGEEPPGYGPAGGVAPGEIRPTIISFDDVFRRTWAIFKQQWQMCVIGVIIVEALKGVFDRALFYGLVAMGHAPTQVDFDPSNPESWFPFHGVTPNATHGTLTFLFDSWLTIGVTIFLLGLARGQRPDLGLLFSGARFYFTFVLATILFTMAHLLGLGLCVVPGIIIWLMFSQYDCLIVDRNLGVMDALNYSMELMRGNKKTLFTIWLVASLLGTLLGLCTCCVGFFAVIPYWNLLSVVCYLMITGQPMVDQLYSPFQQPGPPTT